MDLPTKNHGAGHGCSRSRPFEFQAGFPGRCPRDKCLLFLDPDDRPLTVVELISSMQAAANTGGGTVYADGVDGHRYGVPFEAFEEPAQFHDPISARNAIHYLTREMGVEPTAFRVVPAWEL